MALCTTVLCTVVCQAGASQHHKHMQLIPLQSFEPCMPAAIASEAAHATSRLPIDAAITTAVLGRASSSSSTSSSSSWNKAAADSSKVYRLAQFSGFKHALVPLPAQSQHAAGSLQDWGSYLVQRYTTLLSATGLLKESTNKTNSSKGAAAAQQQSQQQKLGALAPHNVLLTTRWMLIVPRTFPSCADITVNGLAFAGSLVVHSSSNSSSSSTTSADSTKPVKPLSVLRCVSHPTLW
jgi:ATP adenylyltransferase/5',5'''-P-1,P-4-tetraphosphate phosphorylase II